MCLSFAVKEQFIENVAETRWSSATYGFTTAISAYE
jgi:hypothetical protein